MLPSQSEMRTALALIWTSGALLCCGGRTAVDGTLASMPTSTEASSALRGLHLTSSDEISIRDVAVSDDGRVAIGGYYRGRPNLDGIGADLPETSDEDGYVVLLDAQGRAQWAEPLPGLGAQGITGVAFARNGDVLAQGSGNNREADASAAHPDGTAWVMRFDQQGGVRLRKGFSGDRTMPTRVASDSQDSTILVGSFTGQLDFYGPQTIAPPYVVKLDASGAVAWIVHLPVEGDTADLIKLSVAVAPDDSILVSGTHGQLLHPSGFVTKLEPSGVAAWTQQFSSTQSDGYVVVHDVAVDADGNAIVVGNYCRDINLPGPSTTPPRTNNAWVAELDPNGSVRWAKSYWGLDLRRGAAANAVAVDAEQRIWIAGTAEALAFNGETLTGTNGSSIAFILKLLPSGDELWARSGDELQAGFNGLDVGMLGTAWAGGDFTGFIELAERREAVQGKLDAFLMPLEP